MCTLFIPSFYTYQDRVFCNHVTISFFTCLFRDLTVHLLILITEDTCVFASWHAIPSTSCFSCISLFSNAASFLHVLFLPGCALDHPCVSRARERTHLLHSCHGCHIFRRYLPPHTRDATILPPGNYTVGILLYMSSCFSQFLMGLIVYGFLCIVFILPRLAKNDKGALDSWFINVINTYFNVNFLYNLDMF